MIVNKKGIVKWFSTARGTGVIEADGDEYFVRHTEILGLGFKNLSKGEKVLFRPKATPNGLEAVDVEAIERVKETN